MSYMEEIADENVEHKFALSAYYTAINSLDITDVNNTSYRLQTSHNSTISNESDLSLLSLSQDKDLELKANSTDMDELPAFEIRLISPFGRTPSPIDSEDIATPTRLLPSTQERLTPSPCQNNPDFVALHDINAQISPPSDHGDEDRSSLNRTSSLETIFEGVFLNTPPLQRINLQNNRHSRNRTNILEKVALNRLNMDKENQSPLSKSDAPPRRSSVECNFVADACSGKTKHTLS